MICMDAQTLDVPTPMAQAGLSTTTRSHLLPALRDEGQDVRVSRSTWMYESDRTYIPVGKKGAVTAPKGDYTTTHSSNSAVSAIPSLRHRSWLLTGKPPRMESARVSGSFIPVSSCSVARLSRDTVKTPGTNCRVLRSGRYRALLRAHASRYRFSRRHPPLCLP